MSKGKEFIEGTSISALAALVAENYPTLRCSKFIQELDKAAKLRGKGCDWSTLTKHGNEDTSLSGSDVSAILELLSAFNGKAAWLAFRPLCYGEITEESPLGTCIETASFRVKSIRKERIRHEALIRETYNVALERGLYSYPEMRATSLFKASYLSYLIRHMVNQIKAVVPPEYMPPRPYNWAMLNDAMELAIEDYKKVLSGRSDNMEKDAAAILLQQALAATLRRNRYAAIRLPYERWQNEETAQAYKSLCGFCSFDNLHRLIGGILSDKDVIWRNAAVYKDKKYLVSEKDKVGFVNLYKLIRLVTLYATGDEYLH